MSFMSGLPVVREQFLLYEEYGIINCSSGFRRHGVAGPVETASLDSDQQDTVGQYFRIQQLPDFNRFLKADVMARQGTSLQDRQLIPGDAVDRSRRGTKLYRIHHDHGPFLAG